MTPKQKAAELILMYMAIVVKQDIAKKCALAAVDEIMNAIDWHDYDSPNEEWGYWNEVKDEIKKIMNKQQTAVEWLISQHNQYRPGHMPQSQFKQVCEQALAMEKQQQEAALAFAHTVVTKEAPLHYLFNEYNKMIEPTNEENLEYFHKLTEFIKQKTEQLREINSNPIVSDDFQIGPNGAYEHIDPQDKAQKLVAHYEAICKDFTRELRLPHSFAKVCALVTVDAQIELYNELMFLGLLEPNAIGIELVQVKQEIQKL